MMARADDFDARDEEPAADDLDVLSHDTAFCPECGGEIWDQADWCPHCEAWMSQPVSRPVPTDRRRRIVRTVLLVAALACFLAIFLCSATA